MSVPFVVVVGVVVQRGLRSPVAQAFADGHGTGPQIAGKLLVSP
jgi:hypothetical protein